MLTKTQIELVENSWCHLLINPQETAVIFFNKLFEIDPGLRPYFSEDMKDQSRKFIAMITFLVHKLQHLEKILADVDALGRKHEQNSILPIHYEAVASALLQTLESTHGNGWNDNLKEAWILAYNSLAKTMVKTK